MAILLAGAAIANGQAAAFQTRPGPADTNAPEVELKGNVVSSTGKPELKFKAESGATYTLRRTRMSEALFADTNLHSRVLLLKGRIGADERSFEVTGKLRSIRSGGTNDLYYWCDICAIKQIEPGPCMCCRDDVVLREDSAGE